MLPRPFKHLEWHKEKKHRHRRLSLLLKGLTSRYPLRPYAPHAGPTDGQEVEVVIKNFEFQQP
jgi:hypothetical protein